MLCVVFSDQMIIVASFPSLSHFIDKKSDSDSGRFSKWRIFHVFCEVSLSVSVKPTKFWKLQEEI